MCLAATMAASATGSSPAQTALRQVALSLRVKRCTARRAAEVAGLL